MPIDYSKYPPNWNELRIQVLIRAKYKCECCGLGNYEIVYSFKRDGITVWERLNYSQWLAHGQPKYVRVILTVAHLDHDETNHDVKIKTWKHCI